MLPFRIATFGPSPELALLIGNVLAVLLARPVAAQLRFAGRRPLTASATEYAFTPDSPVRHRAGQYLELQLPHRGADRRGIRRTLTIVSPPGDPALRVAVRTREPMSSFKQALDVLPLGSPVRAVTVSGAFTLPDDRSTPAAARGERDRDHAVREPAAGGARGGRGRRGAARRAPRRPGGRRGRTCPYRDVLVASGVRVLVVCPDPGTLGGLPEHWHVAQRFDAAALAAVLPEPRRRIAYVSGSPAFVARARSVLRAAGRAPHPHRRLRRVLSTLAP